MTTINPVSGHASERTAGSLGRSIAIAGPIIGVLNAVDMLVFYHLTLNTSPLLFFQYIASGLLGPVAFADGYTSPLLGILIHFAVAFVVAAVFILAASWSALLRRTVVVSALVYGAAVYLFMGIVVLPLSAAPKLSTSTPILVNGLVGNAVSIGLPLAIMVWRSSRVN